MSPSNPIPPHPPADGWRDRRSEDLPEPAPPLGSWTLVRPPRAIVIPPPRYLLASVLFLVSFLTTTTLGAAWYLWTRTDVTTDLLPWLGPGTLRQVWGDPALLTLGLSFSLPALGILFCHEMGHYLACRYYRLPATLPYFLPAPVGIGTFGAFIRIRAPIRSKKELFDIGVAGPLAGFVALVPFLLYGIARSEPAQVAAVEPAQAAGLLLMPGKSLAIELATRLFHGPLPEGVTLDLHPFALAAWFGLLATAINLLPLGQLDGGHILYAVTGSLQRKVALPLWLLLVAAGIYWPGWLLWCLIVLFMGLPHPPVRDEREPLAAGRRALAAVALLILIFSFMPVPIQEVAVR